MDIHLIEWLEEKVQGALRPDLTLLVDAPVDVGMNRVNSRGKRDRFELEKKTFFERVRSSYLQRAQQYPQQIKVINADQELESVQEEIGWVIQNFFDHMPER